MSARYLRRDGLRVRLVTTPEQALAELTGGPDAAAVLDLTMPGLDPRRIRRALRTPVIFLVAGPRPRRAAWPERRDAPALAGPSLQPSAAGATGLRRAGRARAVAAPGHGPAGAAPPADHAERTGRLRALARRPDCESGPRSPDGQLVPLTATEFAFLAALMDHPGRVLSRRQLLAAAGREAAGDRAADVYIAQLRAKIGLGREIRTVRGAGYAIDP